MLSAGLFHAGYTQDSSTLLKQVNKELRQAERDMFSGETEKAIAALENIEKTLNEIKSADPNSTKLKTAENKYKKLIKDLERRTGRQLGGGTVTATQSSTKPSLPTTSKSQSIPLKEQAVQKEESASSADKVPYAARKPLASANQQLNSLQRNLDKLADPGYSGNKDQLVDNIEAKLVDVQKNLDQAKKFAAEKGVVGHPDIVQAETHLADVRKKVSGARAGYEEKKAVAAAKSSEITSDVANLKVIYDRVRPIFDKANGYVTHYNDLKTLELLIADIERFEQNEQGSIESELKMFASSYGSTANEIEKNANQMGYSGQYKASFPYVELASGIENIKKTRTVMADDIVRRATDQLSNISEGRGHDFSTGDRYADAQAWIQMAARFDADNPRVKDAMGKIENEMVAGMKKLSDQIDGRKWPGHASNAPGNANQLAKAALKWFKADPGWGKNPKEPRQPLSVVVTGPWSVQKKNLLGEPIMYGLPVLLAVQLDSEKSQNVARVYSLTLRTVEQRNVKMEPPFDHVTVGNSYYIRPSAVK
jgi:hypothetical protein